MTQDEQASEEEQKLMSEYGITHEQKSVYFYRGHKYDKLSDAIRYARDGLDRTRDEVSNTSD